MNYDIKTLDLQFPADQLGQVPYLSQWLGLWSIEPNALSQLVQMVESLDLNAHLAAVRNDSLIKQNANRQNTPSSNGVAVISLSGPLQKHASSMGSGSGSTVLARRDIRSAARNPDVGAILLSIESPGGTSAGTQELVDDIAWANSIKPVLAHVTDIGASAAYWIASAARSISANSSALVGSIGTYATVQDSSAAANQQGYKIHVIKAGEFKASGVPGTEVTPEQLAEIQRIVDSRNEFFLKGVAQGRSLQMSKVKELANGKVYTAEEAVSLHLIDSIASFDEAYQSALEAAATYNKPKPRSKGTKMSHQVEQTVEAATSREIKAACPGCVSDFVVDCLDNGRTIEEASRLWSQQLASTNSTLSEANKALTAQVAELTARVSTLEAENKTLAETPEPKPTARIGVAPLQESVSTEPSATSATEGYWNHVKELQVKGSTRSAAMATVNKLFPDLRKAMSIEANS